MTALTICPTSLPYCPGVAKSLRAAIADRGMAIVEDLPLDSDCGALLELAEALGSVSIHGIGPGSNRAKPQVHRVEPLAAERLDRFGNRILSTTADAMACHTDDSFSDNPAAVVMLHAAVPGHGGDSLLVHVLDVLADLAPADAEALARPIYPTPSGYRPILSADRHRIRFSAYEIEKMTAGGMPPLENGAEAVDRLSECLARTAGVLRLDRGECLLLDNHRVLHGRTAITSEAPRLLFRVRLDTLSACDWEDAA